MCFSPSRLQTTIFIMLHNHEPTLIDVEYYCQTVKLCPTPHPITDIER